MANAAEFYYILDQTFKKGSMNFTEAKRLRKQSSEKELAQFFNPEPTSIYMCVSIHGTFMKVNIGLKVKPIDWDFDLKEYKKRKNPDWYENNNFLSNRLSEVRRAYLNMRMLNPDILPEQVKQLMLDTIKGKAPDTKERDFFKVYDLFIIDKIKISKPQTMHKYTILKKHLQVFEKSFYKISFEKITKKFETDFKYFSVNQKKHLNNTISRHLKCLKVYMRFALEGGYHANRDFESFTVRNDDSNIMALTYDEFLTIRNLDLSDFPKLDRVRDLFVFQCLTGQRYSDIANFKFKDLRKREDGYDWVLWQIKNNRRESITIPLLDKAVEIVEKYRKGKELLANDSVLPTISLTNMNLYLKQLGRRAKFNSIESKVNYSGINRIEKSSEKWKILSTHCARRSFVTISLQLGMRGEVVRAITGHKSEKMMAKYVAINAKMRDVEFKDVWDNAIK